MWVGCWGAWAGQAVRGGSHTKGTQSHSSGAVRQAWWLLATWQCSLAFSWEPVPGFLDAGKARWPRQILPPAQWQGQSCRNSLQRRWQGFLEGSSFPGGGWASERVGEDSWNAVFWFSPCWAWGRVPPSRQVAECVREGNWVRCGSYLGCFVYSEDGLCLELPPGSFWRVAGFLWIRQSPTLTSVFFLQNAVPAAGKQVCLWLSDFLIRAHSWKANGNFRLELRPGHGVRLWRHNTKRRHKTGEAKIVRERWDCRNEYRY